jgi:hypothetical protein
MTGRKCQTCKHYEPSPIRRRGWCRNPRLYSPQQSHLVDQDELGCGAGTGSYWEPTDAEHGHGRVPVATEGMSPTVTASRPAATRPEMHSDPAPRRGPSTPRRPGLLRRLLPAPPPLAGAGAFFASGGTGSGFPSAGGGGRGERPTRGGTAGSGFGLARGRGGEDAADDDPDDGGQTLYAGTPRSERAGRLPGQERTVSYQPEERYWTDYLRIALPVVGLLLMLGLFLFWANSLIGDPNGEPPTEAPAAQVDEQITASPPAATATTPVEIAPTPPGDAAGADDAAPPPADAAAGDEAAADQAAEQPAEGDGGDGAADDPAAQEGDSGVSGEFAEGDAVVVSEELNMRSDPSVEGEIIKTLPAGEALTIIGGPTEGDDNTWYEVEDDTADQGWVAAEFLEPAPAE